MKKRFGILLSLFAAMMTPLLGQTVVGTLSQPGMKPYSVAVYEAGNKIFVADDNTGNLHMYDGATNALLNSVFIGTKVYSMVVHESSGKLYAASHFDRKIAVVNAVTGAFITYLAGTYSNTQSPTSLRIDQSLGKVYALSLEGLTKIDVATNSETIIPGFGGGGTEAMDLNPVTHEVLVTRLIPDVLEIVDGITMAKTTVAGLGGDVVGINSAENKVYISRGGGVGVPFEIYDRDTGSINNVFADNDVSVFPFIHNPTSNRMYTSSEVNAISTILEGASDAFFNLPMPSATQALAVRNATSHVYYASLKSICVLDDATQLLELIPVTNPSPSSIVEQAIAINQTTGRVYVINDGEALNFVTVVQDTDTMIRPPIYLGTTGFPQEILVLDPISKTVADAWKPFEFSSESEHAMAVRPGGGRVYAPLNSFGQNKLGIFAGTGTKSLLTSFSTTGTTPRTVAVTPDNSRIYVSNASTSNVSVIDVATNSVITTVTVGSTPWGLAMTPEGAKVYVAVKGANVVKVINVATNTVMNTITVGTSPWGVAINPSGTRAYITNSGAGTVSVIDIATNSVLTTVAVGNTPHWLTVTPDGKSVYVGNQSSGTVSVIDMGTNTVIQTVAVGVNPEGVVALPDGSEVWVVNSNPTGASSLSVINASNYSVSTVALPPAPPPGTNLIGYSLTTADPTSKFAGRVMSGGAPVSGALVRALQGGVEKGSATTNASGDYAIFNLKSGTYDIEASASGYVTQTQSGQTVAPGRITIVNFNLNPIDIIPPPAPISLAATPSSWTNANSFSIDWTNPSDPSGIAAAWHKVGSVPNNSTDGARTTSKPFIASATAQGGQSIYVWLEDGAGNKDHNNRSNTTLFWDATAPTGTISINGGTTTTTSLIVTLNLSATDGMSGMGSGAQMRFSNDNNTWSPAEAYSVTKSNWDLSTFGGNTNPGTKTVYVQFKDFAGNWSGSFSDDIIYSLSNLALNKPATASSTNSSFPAGNAVDGNLNTHWRSGTVSANTVVWWRVDLGATYNINNVVIYWRSSFYAKKYKVQVSLNASTWTTVYTDNAGNGGTDNVTFTTATARYVRIHITQNNSTTERIDEVQVYAAASALAKATDENAKVSAAAIPEEISLSPNYPNPFNPSTNLGFGLPQEAHVTLKVYNMIGEEVATLVNERRSAGFHTVVFEANNLPSGVYFSVLNVGEMRQVRRMVLIR